MNETTLAIHGGKPVKAEILLPAMPGALELGKEEEAAVINVIRSQRLGRYGSPWGTPSQVEALEKLFADHMKSKYCLAVSSGTAALHCALVGLGIGPGDEVIVPAYTWMSTATTVCNVGAVPVVADVDISLTLDPDDIERRISPYTRAIMVVHMRGASARMDRIQAIVKKHNLFIIEDVAQAMGGSFHGNRLGTIGDIGCFSMQTFKILCVGEGGFVTTQDEKIFKKVSKFHGAPPEDQPTLSLNYKMSELQGAIGIVQLTRLERMLTRMRRAKREVKEAIVEVAKNKPIQIREDVDAEGDTGISITIFAETPEKSDAISDAFSAEHIGNFRLYRPGKPDLHLYKHWTAIMNQQALNERGGPWRFAQRKIEYAPNMCPRAVDLLGRSIDISISPQFTEKDIQDTIMGIKKVLIQLA